MHIFKIKKTLINHPLVNNITLSLLEPPLVYMALKKPRLKAFKMLCGKL